MKWLVIVLMVLSLGACTTYSVKKQTPEGYTEVNVKSTRSFEQPNLHYSRQGGDAEFDFKAANADNNTDAIMGVMTSLIAGMTQMMNTMMSNMMTSKPPGDTNVQ